jgi:thiol-disulfide isomerase/thioredoxin
MIHHRSEDVRRSRRTLSRALVCLLCALSAPALQAADAKADGEQQQLEEALSEAGSNPGDFIRVLENHLAKFPKSPRRAEMERAIAKAAIEAKDNQRIVQYGERVLAREPGDLQILDRVTRSLLDADDKASAERALRYARHSEELIRAMENDKPAGRAGAARWRDEVDRGVSRAIVFEARAKGNLGQIPEAIELARKSYQIFPTVEAARETGRWLVRSGKDEEAVRAYADAFTLVDAKATEGDRAYARQRMGELYRKAKGSETGLGDLILEAWDRNAALLTARKARLAELDPNSQRANATDYVLSRRDGGKLDLASLRGKVLVMDFWATWCGPCRVQHPLFETVRDQFKNDPSVVFLSVNTDEDRAAVPAFLEEQKWGGEIYYEDGLSVKLNVSSIPTTIIVNRRGEVANRMNGFIPERFVGMLTQRIHEALKQ